jgi:hypothetical protein
MYESYILNVVRVSMPFLWRKSTGRGELLWTRSHARGSKPGNILWVLSPTGMYHIVFVSYNAPFGWTRWDIQTHGWFFIKPE